MSSEFLAQLERESEALEHRNGLSSLDLLMLPKGVRGFLQAILRQGKNSAQELSQKWELPANSIQRLLERLEHKGYLSRTEDEGAVYQVNLIHKRRAQLPPEI